MLKQAGHNCYLGGNIGIPLFAKIDEMKPSDIVVLELSNTILKKLSLLTITSEISTSPLFN